MDPLSDSLIAQAQAGNSDALTTLYEQYKQPIYGYFYYKIGDAQSAEDLTGELFLRVIENLPKYRQRDVPFRAWLFRIASNMAVDYFRKMNVRNHLPLDERVTADQESAPDIITEQRLTGDRLKAALQQLTSNQSDVIILRFVADMPIKQVAQVLNKSESAVKALQARALEALQHILAPQRVSHE
jgi:RNA polymerase sigma-70 factor, ECF subfamily